MVAVLVVAVAGVGAVIVVGDAPRDCRGMEGRGCSLVGIFRDSAVHGGVRALLWGLEVWGALLVGLIGLSFALDGTLEWWCPEPHGYEMTGIGVKAHHSRVNKGSWAVKLFLYL